MTTVYLIVNPVLAPQQRRQNGPGHVYPGFVKGSKIYRYSFPMNGGAVLLDKMEGPEYGDIQRNEMAIAAYIWSEFVL